MNTTAFSIAVMLAATFLSACGKSTPEAVKVPEMRAKAAPSALSEDRFESEITNALANSAPGTLILAASDLQREAEAIIAKYPGKTATDLLNVPEVNVKLRSLLGKLAQDKALQARINTSVDLAAQIKGLEGAAKLDLDMKDYSQERTSRMLQAALSEDPKQLVAYLVGEIGEAAPDISYGGLDRAPNGVSILPNPAAAKAPKPNLPD